MTEQMTNIFFNWLLLHAAGLASMIVVFDRCFARRHSIIFWLLYVGVRGLVRSYMSAALATGVMSPGLYTFDVIFIAVTAVASFIMLWFTWKADPIKIGITGIVADLLTGTAMVLCIGTANLLENGAFTPGFTTLNFAYTVGAAVSLFLMVLLMLRLFDPVVRWYRKAEFAHRRLLAAVIIIAAALFSSTNLTDTAGFDASSYVVCLIGVILLAPLVIYGFRTIDLQRNRRVLLRQQSEMSSAYIIAVDSQSESIASHRRLLDSISAQIDSSESGLTSEELRSYINDLKTRSDRLKSGKYSSNIAADAVLTAFAERFRAHECDAVFKIDALADDDARAIEISWIFLNWAESVIGDAGGSVKYSIMRQGRQLIFALVLTGAGKSLFPERQLKGHIGRYDVISQKHSGDTLEVKLMTAASAIEEKEGA